MNKKTIITLAIIFHQFASGYWFIGFSVPGSTSIAMDSNNVCVRYTGETSECSSSDRFLLNYLYKLNIYENENNNPIINNPYTFYSE